MAESLKNQSIAVEYISALTEESSFLLKQKERLYHYFKKRYLRDRDPLLLKGYAREVSRRLSNLDIDIVFSPGTIPIAYLECSEPIVFWTDATFAGMIDYYPNFSNLCRETLRNGNAMEESALQRCKLAIYSSEWAAQTAVENYHIDPSKVKVVPFGANLECNRSYEDIEAIIESRTFAKCRLLFMGVDWFRKGGDIALEVVKELNKEGLPTELTIVGCQPIAGDPLPDFIKPLGFINKATGEGFQRISKLLADSHFLIFPSRAECYGIVLCEANSFGVPCLATNTGGIPTIIKEGLNGKLFSKNAEITEYSTYISNLFSDYPRYKKLALSSFNEYQSRLNWSFAAQTVKKLLLDIM